MRKPVVLITGASGEIGHGLIERLAAEASSAIVTIDLKPLDDGPARRVTRQFTGSIVDRNLLDAVLAEFEVDTIYHLAALLSTRAEFTPTAAHAVNVDGTMNLLGFALAEGASHGQCVSFIFPSSIAAYGLPDLETKARAGRVTEDEWNLPRTMYGCNKLYCEHMGRYHARYYRQLNTDRSERLDFRAIRFPGLISSETLPSGGTSDYAPEMLHSAARGVPYACFVRPDTRIPFMAMPDAVEALLQLRAADGARLTRTVYNIAAFNPSAEEIREIVVGAIPGAEVTFAPDVQRQAIVDSWPEDVDDGAARREWGFRPRYDLKRAFDEYLIPRIRERYR